jgi:hypothetical protein
VLDINKSLASRRGFSVRNIKNMRIFYEGWSMLERPNSSVATDEFTENNNNSAVATAEFEDDKEIRQLQLANLPDFPLREFLSISFTHHIAILAKSKAYDERIFYMKYADSYKPTVEELEKVIKQDLYHHQDKMPNNSLLLNVSLYPPHLRGTLFQKENKKPFPSKIASAFVHRHPFGIKRNVYHSLFIIIINY